MKVGDLVKFKQSDFMRLYGVGVLLGKHHPTRVSPHRYWAFFNGECIVVRLSELEVINESR